MDVAQNFFVSGKEEKSKHSFHLVYQYDATYKMLLYSACHECNLNMNENMNSFPNPSSHQDVIFPFRKTFLFLHNNI